MGDRNADLLCGLLAARGELLAQLRGLLQETAWTRPEPQEWSVVEILQHLADHDQVTLRRFQGVLADNPQMARRVAEEWTAVREEAEGEGLPGVLRRLYSTFEPLLEVISTMTEVDLEKPAVHHHRGPMTLRQVVILVANHDRDHVRQLAETRLAVEGRRV